MICQGGNHVWPNGTLVCVCGQFMREPDKNMSGGYRLSVATRGSVCLDCGLRESEVRKSPLNPQCNDERKRNCFLNAAALRPKVDKREQNVIKRTPLGTAHQTTCPECKGTGNQRVNHKSGAYSFQDCPTCNGRGYLKRKL